MTTDTAAGQTAEGPLADREWRLITEEARNGPAQMAFDEVAAETAAAGGPRTVRLYRWTPSCLSLGRHQSPETVDWDACRAAGVDVTRRPTGGGGIYHDSHGDISYSVIAPADELPGDLMESYHLLCEPVVAALRALGADADYVASERPSIHQPACYLRGLNPAHDVVSDGGDGRKLAGNAQHRQREAVVQHGSISYAVDAEAHLRCFADPETTDEAFHDRVAGLDELTDADRETAVETLQTTLADWAGGAPEAEWTDAERGRAAELVDERYADDDWVRADPRELRN
ncbi:MAG: lipoate-protein ligase A [halophilic archaeon J07HB67]|nr:MAG: lipoate-protein ligase A [halophilic archaeon J07HB67]